ncbi:MAG: UDP-glucose/GDP-mannose dehydrogenase family protein [Synergistaceae bacterium]|jgi:UDPglucose 6-dehydrogenase|nr:UDP-glucose/GDP-mannose dehydrogenase family protein [Synergistaceae bacterium]
MKLAIIGAGYVGLVTGTCLARFGNTVVCVDTDKKKIDMLNRGEVPFYEPGLPDMVKRNMREGRLSFSPELPPALEDTEACFVCVGTPAGPNGGANLCFVESASRDIGRSMTRDLLVVVKSTVPVGTNVKVQGWIVEELERRGVGLSPEMVSNPEFLREGAAVQDFVEPDRVVVGVNSPETIGRMRELYSFLEPEKVLFMDIASAEMSKYASNAMLATRISFMNEMANICERVGANVDDVRHAMAFDTRIGSKFLYAGCGYGGSCFPKDVRAIRDFAASAGYVSQILTAVDEVNLRQKEVLFQKLAAHFEPRGGIQGRTVALWGLSFKPKTSDTREAPAQTLIRRLLREDVRVQAHDPRSIEETRGVLGEHRQLLYMSTPYDALCGADALVVATEWDIYKQPDFDRVRRLLKEPVIVDGRNLYALSDMRRRGFDYYSVGRPVVRRG